MAEAKKLNLSELHFPLAKLVSSFVRIAKIDVDENNLIDT